MHYFLVLTCLHVALPRLHSTAVLRCFLQLSHLCCWDTNLSSGSESQTLCFHTAASERQKAFRDRHIWQEHYQCMKRNFIILQLETNSNQQFLQPIPARHMHWDSMLPKIKLPWSLKLINNHLSLAFHLKLWLILFSVDNLPFSWGSI